MEAVLAVRHHSCEDRLATGVAAGLPAALCGDAVCVQADAAGVQDIEVGGGDGGYVGDV